MIALLLRRAVAAGYLTAALAIIAAPGTEAVSQPATSSSLAELLTSYAAWIQGGRTGVELVAVDLDAARATLSRFDPSTLPTTAEPGTAAAREEQRRLVTAFALELAAVGARRHATAAARLVEWACPYVRAHSPKNDFDRAWQLAALAVLEGGIDATALRDHVDHIRPLFPDEPRLLLARGIAEEQVSAPSEVLSRSVIGADLARARDAAARADGERFRASERAIDRFRDAAQHESIRAEANLRLAHVKIEMGRYDDALAALTGVEDFTRDPAIAYLADLFRGIALESRGRVAEARAAYRRALALSAGAHSATMRLAALEFRHGRGSDPEILLAALLRDADPHRDPWWSYYAGDWRDWYPRIERVRALVKP